MNFKIVKSLIRSILSFSEFEDWKDEVRVRIDKTESKIDKIINAINDREKVYEDREIQRIVLLQDGLNDMFYDMLMDRINKVADGDCDRSIAEACFADNRVDYIQIQNKEWMINAISPVMMDHLSESLRFTIAHMNEAYFESSYIKTFCEVKNGSRRILMKANIMLYKNAFNSFWKKLFYAMIGS